MDDSEFDDSDVEEIDLFPNVEVTTCNDTTNNQGVAAAEIVRDGPFSSAGIYPHSESSAENVEVDRCRPVSSIGIYPHTESSAGNVDTKRELEDESSGINSKLFEITTREQSGLEQEPFTDVTPVSFANKNQNQNYTSLQVDDDSETPTIESFKLEDNDILDEGKLYGATEIQRGNDKRCTDEAVVASDNLPVLENESKVSYKNKAMLDDESNLETEKEVYNKDSDITSDKAAKKDQSNGFLESVVLADKGSKEVSDVFSNDKSIVNSKEEFGLLPDCKISRKRTSEEYPSKEDLQKRQKSLDNLQTSFAETGESVSGDLIINMKTNEQNEQKKVVCKNENRTDILQEKSNEKHVLNNYNETKEQTTNSECPPIAIVSPLGGENHHSPVDSMDGLYYSDQNNEAMQTSNNIEYGAQTSADEFSIDEMVNSIFEAEKSDTFQTLDGSSWIFPDLEDITRSQKVESFTNSLDPKTKNKNTASGFEIVPADIQAIIKQEIPTVYEENVSASGNTENDLGKKEASNVSKGSYPSYSVSTERITPPPSEIVTQTSTYQGILKQGPPNRIAPNVDNIPYTNANDYSELLNLLQAVKQAQNQKQSIASTNNITVASTVWSNTYSTANTVPSTQSTSVFKLETTHMIPPRLTGPHNQSPPLNGPLNQSLMYPRQPHLNQVRPEYPGNRSQAINNIYQYQRSSSVGSADSGYTSPVKSTTPVSLPQYQNHLPRQYHHQQQPYLASNWNQQTRPNPYTCNQSNGKFVMPNQRQGNSLPQTSNIHESSLTGVTCNQSIKQAQPNFVQSQIATQNLINISVSYNDSCTNPQVMWNKGVSCEPSMQASPFNEIRQMSPCGTVGNFSQHSNQQQHVPQLASNPLSANIQMLSSNNDQQRNNTINPSSSSTYQNTHTGSSLAADWNSSHGQFQSWQSPSQSMLTIRQKLSNVMALANAHMTPAVKLLVRQFINKLNIARQSNLNEAQKYKLVNDTKKFISDITYLCQPSVVRQTSKAQICASEVSTSGIGARESTSGNINGCGNYGFVSNSVSVNPRQSGYHQHASADGHSNIAAPSMHENKDTYPSVLNYMTVKSQYGNNLSPSISGLNYQNNQLFHQSGSSNNMIGNRTTTNQSFSKDASVLKSMLGHNQYVSNNAVTQNVFNHNKSTNIVNELVNGAGPNISGQTVYQGTLAQAKYQASALGSMTCMTDAVALGNFMPQVSIQFGHSQVKRRQGNDCFITGTSGLNNTHNNALTTDNYMAELDGSTSLFDDINPLEKYVS